jgi:glutamine synthetase
MATLDEATRARRPSEMLGEAISSVRVTFPDLHGIQRGKDIPVSELDRVVDDGVTFCWAVMGTDLRHTPVVGGERGYPDMVARPELETLVELPWDPGVASCLCLLEREGEPEPTDPRRLVRRAEGALAELGLAAKIGPELEFFLCSRGEDGGVRRYVDNLSMVYTVGPQADPRGLYRELLGACAGLGIGAFAANHEYMNSQYEINLRECGAAAAADNAFRFKAAVKDFAAARGMLATFMGRPFNDQGGSGMHLHLSLDRDGENAFADPGSDAGLSAEARAFTAGILDHAPALMAFLDPTINAYRRILPDSLAPTHANWGLDNRTTFIRIPPERGSGSRVELRVGDGTANPYLVIAATMFAGADGLRRRLDPGPPLEGDTYQLPDEEQGGPLPATLDAALDALEADELIAGSMGPELVETFVTMKRFECERYRQHVSEWDRDEYIHHL